MSNARSERGSIFTGLLLILLGAVLLLSRFHPEFGLAHLLYRYWPVLFIVWGCAKLVDYFLAGWAGDTRPPLLTGSEAAVLALLVVVLAGAAALEWLPRVMPNLSSKTEMFESKADQSQSLPSVALPPGSPVRIAVPAGSFTVRGSDSQEMRVSADEQAAGTSERAARMRLSGVQLGVDHSSKEYFLRVSGVDAGDRAVHLNLDIELPRHTPLTLQTGAGDITVSDIMGSVTAETGAGDIDIHDCQGNVAATIATGDAHIADIQGNVALNGHGDDVDINDITGNASAAGSYTGTVVFRNVTGNTQYAETRTSLVLANLSGRMEADSENLKITDVNGPLKVATKDKDVNIENVHGPLDVSNTRGDINVLFDRAPDKPIALANETGDVTLTLPENASFQISAVAGSGEVDSDFSGSSLQINNGDNSGKMTGSIGQNGPKITITTSYGTIQLRKSS